MSQRHPQTRRECLGQEGFYLMRIYPSSVYNKTLEYVKTFTRFQTSDSAGAVRE